MEEITHFGLVVLVPALVVLVAVQSSHLSAWLRVPAPAVFLLGAAAASNVIPGFGPIPLVTVDQIVTVALVVILFDGGMHIGWQRFRGAAGAVVWLGVMGTVVTTAGLAAAAHFLFGLGLRESLLLGTA
ncbi:MAG TPA: cation:proton antiporter, partial [Micromonosporaceae bacterium]|nr:cation:proton antiporter [Micromonosporaceae bacterium]